MKLLIEKFVFFVLALVMLTFRLFVFVLTIALALFPPFWVFLIVYFFCGWLYGLYKWAVYELQVPTLERELDELDIDFTNVKIACERFIAQEQRDANRT